MAFTLASTTDTQEQVDHAAADDWRETAPEPAEPVEGAEAPETPEEPRGGEEGTRSEQPSGDPAEAPRKRQGGYQKRIARMAAQLGEREAEIEKLRQQLAERSAGPPAAAASPAADKEPNADDFENVGDYVRAVARWEARQAQREAAEHAYSESESARQQEVFNAYNDRVAQARAKYEDFDDVVGTDRIQIPQSAAVAIIESDNGPEIAYWLGRNPEAVEALSGMSPAQAAVEVGRISERLARPAPSRTRPLSAAPAPATPVRGSAPQNAPRPEEMSFRDYVRARRAGTIR